MTSNSKAILIDLQKKNFYSLTPLIASIDRDERLRNLDLKTFKSLNSQILKKHLNKYDEIVVAISFRSAQLTEIYDQMKQFYDNLSYSEIRKITFIAGGSHPSGDPLNTLKMGFDYAFIGEAEYSLSDFLNRFLEKGDLKATPGVAYFDDNREKIVKKSNPPLIDLNDYPLVSQKRGLYPPLEITRGCSFGCKFCQVPNLFHHNVRHRSPDIVIDTVKWMMPRKLSDIRFITPNSFGYMSKSSRSVNKEAILQLLSSISSLEGIRSVYFGTFPGEVRPETVTEDLVSAVKPLITNRRISIGLQSGSEKVLQKIIRGHSVEEGIKAINILISEGFQPIVDFIFGLPGASEQDEMESINIVEYLVKESAIIRAHVFMPLPGTAFKNETYGRVPVKIRKKLGLLTKEGKIEGNWATQEKYVEEAWKTAKAVTQNPIIKREDNHN